MLLFLPQLTVPSRPSPSLSGRDFAVTTNFKESLNKTKSNIPWHFFLGIWSWTADSSSVRCQACVWKRDLWKGVLRNQSVYLCMCAHLKSRSCYNIGLYHGEHRRPAVARYSTARCLQQSKQKTHQGFTGRARHNEVSNPPRHNVVFFLSFIIKC